MLLPQGEYIIKVAGVKENWFPLADSLALLPILLDVKVRSNEKIKKWMKDSGGFIKHPAYQESN